LSKPTNYTQSFDSKSDNLASALDEFSIWSAPFGINLLDTISYKKNINILDIGFGTGFPLIELAQRFGEGSHVYGIDPWVAGTNRANFKIKEYRINNITLINSEAESLPFNDVFFELIVSNNGLNNVSSLDSVIKECGRILKKNGQMVFTFNTSDTMSEFYKIFHEVLKDNNLVDEIKKLNHYIYNKRRPIEEYVNILKANAIEVVSSSLNSFNFKYASAKAFFNHFFIKLAFLPSWKEILKNTDSELIFSKIEKLLDEISNNKGLDFKIPFYTLNCRKI